MNKGALICNPTPTYDHLLAVEFGQLLADQLNHRDAEEARKSGRSEERS